MPDSGFSEERLLRLTTDQDWQAARELLDEEDIKILRLSLLLSSLKNLGWHPPATKLSKKVGLDVKTVRTILANLSRISA